MAGEVDKIKGKVKQAAGDLTKDERLKTEGEVDELRGNVKETIDNAADNLKRKV